MQTLGWALLCKRWGGHFYANVGVNTFTQTLGWTLLRKRWGGHFYANVGVGTLIQTLGWTLFRKRWGGHFHTNAGVGTNMQTLGQALLCKRWGVFIMKPFISALAQDLWISRFGTLSRMVHFLLTLYYETIHFQLQLRISGFLDLGRCPELCISY